MKDPDREVAVAIAPRDRERMASGNWRDRRWRRLGYGAADGRAGSRPSECPECACCRTRYRISVIRGRRGAVATAITPEKGLGRLISSGSRTPGFNRLSILRREGIALLSAGLL